MGQSPGNGLITCPPEAKLGEAARLLVTHKVHSLVVAEEGGPPLGVISDTDLLAGEWLAGDAAALATMRGMTARDMMTKPALTVEAGIPAAEAIARMQKDEVHRLIVTEGGQAVGVVSVSDFVAGLASAPTGRSKVGDSRSSRLSGSVSGLVPCAAFSTRARRR